MAGEDSTPPKLKERGWFHLKCSDELAAKLWTRRTSIPVCGHPKDMLARTPSRVFIAPWAGPKEA